MSLRTREAISMREVYGNKQIRLLGGKAEFPKGCRTIYNVCEHGGRVDVLPFNPDQNGLIVHYYCYLQRENHCWQIPIGEIPPGELPE